MYFDNVMAIYNHYVVLESRFKVSVAPSAAGSTDGGTFVVYLNDDTTVVPTSIDGCAEQSSSSNVKISAVQDFPISTYCSYSATKVFGPNPIQNVELKGDSGSNCADTVAYTLAYAANNGNGAVNVLIEIEYLATFFEVKDQQIN